DPIERGTQMAEGTVTTETMEMKDEDGTHQTNSQATTEAVGNTLTRMKEEGS
ncbi:hypothetical protein A2U01_0075378, partial [Trifolium medium]|nr:hypothetical protein [Trifolium medium]